MAEAAFKIPLYKALYDHYQGEIPSEDDFFAILLNLTKAERMDVQNQTARIRGLFVEVMGKVGGTIVPPQAPQVRSALSPPIAAKARGAYAGLPPSPALLEFHAGEILHQSFPFTPEGVDQLARVLKDDGFWSFLRAQAGTAQGKRNGNESQGATTGQATLP